VIRSTRDKTDPDALNNLIADPASADVLAVFCQELANEMYRTDDFVLEKFEREIGVTASDEPPRVVRDVITHECLDKVVAVVVARLHPQFERLTGVGAGG